MVDRNVRLEALPLLCCVAKLVAVVSCQGSQPQQLTSRVYTLSGTQTIYVGGPDQDGKMYPNGFDYQQHVKLLGTEGSAVYESARLLVRFDVFSIPFSSFCGQDFIQFLDKSAQIRTYCGWHRSRTLLTEGNEVRLRYRSRSRWIVPNQYRFSISPYYSPCSGDIEITDPGEVYIPGNGFGSAYYASNMLCILRLLAPQGKRVLVTFAPSFEVISEDERCLQDYVAIGKSGTINRNSPRYCGTNAPDRVLSERREMKIKFQSDCCNNARGFAFRYELVDATDNITTCENYQCGVSEALAPRIVNGENAEPNVFPWMAAVFDTKETICGASILSKQYLLTAAHCCYKKMGIPLSVKVGVNNIKEDVAMLPVKKCHMHEKYDGRATKYDIAVLELQYPIPEFNSSVGPICMARQNTNYTGMIGDIAGWGYTSERGVGSDVMKRTKQKVISAEECYEKLFLAVSNNTFCAEGNNTDSCQGDSGGPLMLRTETPRGFRYEQIGIISAGLGCGRMLPAIYVDVTTYRDFIQDVSGIPWCPPNAS